jgi:hypothetical protein
MFVAGVTVTAFAPKVARAFESAGELLAEVLKLAAVLAFGALFPSDSSPASRHVNGHLPWRHFCSPGRSRCCLRWS